MNKSKIRKLLKKNTIMENVSGKRYPVLRLREARLDFAQSFIYDGMTSSGRVRLREFGRSPAGAKFKRRFGKIKKNRNNIPILEVNAGGVMFFKKLQ